MAKRVEYEGMYYKIDFSSYGYTMSVLHVNGEATSKQMNNSQLNNIEAFKSYAKAAIEEYIEKKITEKAFNKWDGKL